MQSLFSNSEKPPISQPLPGKAVVFPGGYPHGSIVANFKQLGWG